MYSCTCLYMDYTTTMYLSSLCNLLYLYKYYMYTMCITLPIYCTILTISDHMSTDTYLDVYNTNVLNDMERKK